MLRVKAGCRKGQQGPEPTRQGGGIGQDAGPGPKCSITLLAAVGWFRGLISLDSRRVPFLSDEVVRTHRMCWAQPSGPGVEVCVLCLSVHMKLHRSDALEWTGEAARWGQDRALTVTTQHTLFFPAAALHVLLWKISEKDSASIVPCGLNVCFARDTCLLSNTRGGFWEVYKRPDSTKLEWWNGGFPWGQEGVERCQN